MSWGPSTFQKTYPAEIAISDLGWISGIPTCGWGKKQLFGGPSTFQLRKAEDCKEEVLKEGSEARKYAVSLKGLAYGDQLVDQLFSHSAQMEKLYEKATELLASNGTKDPKLQKFIDVYKEKSAWFEKAKAGDSHVVGFFQKYEHYWMMSPKEWAPND